jgi:predicted transcriptional regulator YdeE
MARMTREPVTHERMTVVGVDVRTSNAAEADAVTARLPDLWRRFYAENVLERVPGKKSPATPLGLYTDYSSDHTGEYRVVAGAAVEEGTRVPEGLVSATLPAGRYLVFSGEGQVPDVVIRTWMSVWEYFSEPGAIMRAFTADFEQYRGPTSVDIYISVR